MAKPTLNIQGIKNNVLFLSSQRNQKFLLKDWNVAGNWINNPRKDFEEFSHMKAASKSLEQRLKSPRESGDPWSPPTVRFSLPV